MRVFILFLPCLFLVNSSYTQGVYRPKNDFLYDFTFELIDSSFSDYILYAPFHMNQSSPDIKSTGFYPVILDSRGYVAMYYKSNHARSAMFQYFEDLDQFSMVHLIETKPHYYILNNQFEVIDSVENSPEIDKEGHEYKLLSNGHAIIAGQKFDTADLSGLIIGGNPGWDSTVLRGFVIEELDAANNLVFQWNSNNYVSPTESNLINGYNQQDFDYCHGNAIEKDENGDYYLSFRNTSSIYKVDGTDGNVLWRLGGTNSSFTFPNDSGFSGQHDIRVLPNGNLSLFDNGNTKPGVKYSRAIEIALDTITMEANVVWEYKSNDNIYARAMGNHHVSSKRNHLINYGRLNRPFPSITVTDDNANELCHVYFQDSLISYRSYLMNGDFDLKRPKLECTRVNNTLVLSLDSLYPEMIWSINETQQSIEVSDPGSYQAWIKRGDAMIGSYPVIIEDVTQYCFPNGINDLSDYHLNSYKTAYYNLLGQLIEIKNYHGVYLERQSSGTFIKKWK